MVAGPSNPFATRFTRPGRIPPQDDHGRSVDVEALLDRFDGLRRTAAIVGPHGSGKSTLLVHLADAQERRGIHVRRVRLRSWRDAAEVWTAIRGSRPWDTVCVDGWESVGCVLGAALRMARWVSSCGLLVTAHRDVGLPPLVRFRPTASLLRSIVRSLPGNERWYGTWIRESDIEAAFAMHGGNLRESLYELYDRFEAAARRHRDGVGDGPDAGDGCADGRREIHESVTGFSYVGAPGRNLG